MTVQNTIVKNVYVGNGSTTVFPFTFECNKAEHIQAFVKDAAGNISSTTNFKVNLDQKNVTYPNTGEPLPDGYKLIILRQLPLQQLLNLLNQGPFYAEDIEETFDEVVMMLQQMTERIGRSLAVSIDIDAENSFNTIIPLEAGKTFRVKDDGTGFEVTEDPGKVIDGAKALLKLTTEQAEFAKEQADASSQSAVSAQNAATSVKKYKSLWFDSLAAMKAEPSLTAGAYVNTAGYYAPNDGGGASYLIRARADSDTVDNGSLHELSNGLVAEMIIENGTVCPEQFGARGDGVTDDRIPITNAINYAKTVVFSNNYAIYAHDKYRPTIFIPSNITLIFKGVINFYSNDGIKGGSLFHLFNVENVKMVNPTLVSKTNSETKTGDEFAIKLRRTKNCTLLNVKLYGFGSDGINITHQSYDSVAEGTEEYNENIYIDRVYIDAQGYGRNGVTVSNCKDSYIGSIVCLNIPAVNEPSAGIDIEVEKTGLEVNNLKIGSVYARNCGKPIAIQANKTFYPYYHVSIGEVISEECTRDFSGVTVGGNFSLDKQSKVSIDNIILKNVNTGGGCTFECKNISITINNIDAINCNFAGQVIYSKHDTSLYMDVNHINFVNSTTKYLYAFVADSSWNEAENKIHNNLYGIDFVDNFIQRKGVVRWINSFRCKYIPSNEADYNTVYAPILVMNNALKFINPQIWGNAEVTFYIDDGGSYPLTNANISDRTFNIKGTYFTIKYNRNSDLSSVTPFVTNINIPQ